MVKGPSADVTDLGTRDQELCEACLCAASGEGMLGRAWGRT